MSERTIDKFRKRYPTLVKELGGPGTIKIKAVRSSSKEAEKAGHWTHGYQPTTLDFIRRCENEGQALEVIEFQETRGEIGPSYAKRLRAQLTNQGLRSFGTRREPGCYERGETG